MNEPLKGGVYRHWKGLMVFVLGVARHSETEERLVAYIPLGAKAGPRITVRPYGMFCDQVDRPEADYSGPRFTYVGEVMPEGIDDR